MSTESAASTGSRLFRSLTSSRKKSTNNINTNGSDDAPIKPQRAGTLRMRARQQMGETAEERRKVNGGAGGGGGLGGDGGRKTPEGLVIDPTTGLGSDGKLYIKNLDDPSQPPASTYQPPPSLSPESRARAQFASTPSSEYAPSSSQYQPQTVRLRDGTIVDVSTLLTQQQGSPTKQQPATTGRSRSSSRAHQRPSANDIFQTDSAPPLPSLPLAPLPGDGGTSSIQYPQPPVHERKSSWTPQPGYERGFSSSSTTTTTTTAPQPSRSESNPRFPSPGPPPSSYVSAPPQPAPILRARSSSNAPSSAANDYSLGGGSDQGHGAAAGGDGGGWNKVKRSMTLTRKGTKKGPSTRDPNRPPSPERRAAAPKVYTPAELASAMERSQKKPTVGKEEERLTESAFY